MTAKMSDRGDNLTEANLQAEGLREEPAQRAADRQEMEEEDSSPHNLLTWSPVQRPPTGRLNTNYCLLIQVILTDELGDVPPHSHSWMTPVIEYMLRETRAGLMEAVFVGPGRAILFYGRCSLGEGLKADEARDTTFLLTGAGACVGKLVYHTADPMTLQEGKRAIACAVLDHGVKARGPGHPQVNPPAQPPFRFNTSRASPPGNQSAHEVPEDRQTPKGLPEAVATIGEGVTKDHNPPDIYPLYWTEASRATRVQSPQHLLGHPSQTVQMVLGIHDETGDDRRKLI